MKVVAVAKLMSRNLEHIVEFGKEHVDALLLILDFAALKRQLHDVDGRERQVASSHRCLFAKAVFKHTGAASHGGNFIFIAFGVVGTPLFVIVVCGIEVHKVREETACSNLACILIEVVVAVLRQIAHSTLLFPNLNREDGGGTVAHAFVGRLEQLAYDASSFSRGVGAVVNRAEHHLVAATRVDGVHVVDERFHCLVNACHGAVDGMLQYAFIALKVVEWFHQIVVELQLIHVAVVLTIEFLDIFHLLNKRRTHVWCQIEVECRDGLSAVHLVLCCLKRYAGNHACRFDALGRTRFAVTGCKAIFQNVVERVLHAGEALGGIIILVVYVQIVATHCLFRLWRKQIVVNKLLGGFAGKLHNHAGRAVGIHVGVFACHVVVLGIDNFQEHVAGLGVARNAALVAIGNIFSRNLFARTLHQFIFHHILYLLHFHVLTSACSDTVNNAHYQAFVFALLGLQHCFANGCLYLLFVIAHNSPISFYNGLYHFLKK